MNNKQIEEIAIIVEHACDDCNSTVDHCIKCPYKCTKEYGCGELKTATDLYNAGYQKQKQGKWLITAKGCIITCSNCKERVDLYYPDGTQTDLLPYCPYCGSKNKEK